MNIPDEAMEAAKANLLPYVDDDHFDLTEVIRAALAAAAPHLMAEALSVKSLFRAAKAQAWDEGWDAFADFDHRQAGPYPTNPYMEANA